MSELFDDISRVIGSRLPRRRLLKLLAGVLAGGAIGARRFAQAQTKVACGAEFYMTGRVTILIGDCTGLGEMQFKAKAATCYAAARTDAQTDAAASCPASCPNPVERSWANGDAYCNDKDPSVMQCWGTGKYTCRAAVVSPVK